MTTEALVCAAVVVRAGHLLLVRRRVAEGCLSWQLPAGKAEPEESAEVAAAREALEETGVLVEPVQYLGERVHPLTRRRMAYVACKFVSGEAHVVDADEIAQVAWAAPDEWSDLVPYGFAPMVQDYLASVEAC